MKSSRSSVAVVAAALLACAGVVSPVLAQTTAATRPARQFAHPDRIRYDGQCLTIDGRDTFVFSGAFHYFRVPKENWRDRFAKIKAAGFNCVETYVPWSWHEQQRPAGLDDASQIDLSDLVDWMRMAHEEFGLYTIIRPSPYICAEWAGGGFPQWLWSFKPDAIPWGRAWVRTDDPTFLAWSKHWLDAVTPIVAAEQITRKSPGQPGVILFQIENEYDFVAGVPASARVPQLKFLYENARANGIDVPIFTCWTREVRGSTDADLSQVFDGPNLYTRWNMADAARRVREVKRQQPDAPAFVPELQGGWFSEEGGLLSVDQPGVDAAQCNAITMTTIANGATLLNYYMLVGGSNFGTWASGKNTQTYDYNAPIRETGGVTEKYAAVAAIGRFLQQHGSEIARSQDVEASVAPDARVEVNVRVAQDGTRFVFCRNLEPADRDAQFDVKLSDGETLHATHRLPGRMTLVWRLPAGKSEAQEGEWFGEPIAAPARPATMPASVRVAEAKVRADDEPTGEWTAIGTSDPSLVARGVYDVGDVVYRATATLTQPQADALVLLRAECDEPNRLIARVNGHVKIGRAAGSAVDFDVGDALRAGENTVELLYEYRGYPGFGAGLHKAWGVGAIALAPASARAVPLENWRVAVVDVAPADAAGRKEVAADLDDAGWAELVLNAETLAELAASRQPGAPPMKYPAAAILDGRANATAIYRTVVELTADDLAARPIRLDVEQVDDEGVAFVNGVRVGETRNVRRPLVADVTDALRVGRNVIAIVVRNRDGVGGLTKLASLHRTVETTPLDRALATRWRSKAETWSAPDAAGEGWQPVALDATSTLAEKAAPSTRPAEAAQSMRKWFRAEFELPAARPDEFVPWGATIDAAGNGYVYLNGHNLGRYYDAGPQRRFYLPEPWLRRGPGERNTLAFVLHPALGEPTLRAIELKPFADQAEQR